MKRLHDAWVQTTLYILDNECSGEIKDVIKEHKMKHQLVPPNDHQHNAAEKAVQIFKDHFIAVLCGMDSNFPMQLWCQPLPHTEVQLNMLRKLRSIAQILAFAHLNSQHNYDVAFLASLELKLKFMSCLARDVHGGPIPNRVSAWDQHGSTTGATLSGSQTPAQNASDKQYFSNIST